MSKISKLLVMAVVVLAVITMSLNVNAGTTELTNYVTNYHVINGMMFELTNSQKTAVRDYIASNVTDAQADAAYAKIQEAEKLVAESGATNVGSISASVKSQVISLAKEAATSVGLSLTVNTANNTYSLSNGSTVLVSGNADSSIVNPSAAPAGNAAAPAANNGSTLLYTGANYAVYAVVALAIVAVAVVAKKRA